MDSFTLIEMYVSSLGLEFASPSWSENASITFYCFWLLWEIALSCFCPQWIFNVLFSLTMWGKTCEGKTRTSAPLLACWKEIYLADWCTVGEEGEMRTLEYYSAHKHVLATVWNGPSNHPWISLKHLKGPTLSPYLWLNMWRFSLKGGIDWISFKQDCPYVISHCHMKYYNRRIYQRIPNT